MCKAKLKAKTYNWKPTGLLDELEWLRFFYRKADFGPAHEDVMDIIREAYVKSGGVIPEGYSGE